MGIFFCESWLYISDFHAIILSNDWENEMLPEQSRRYLKTKKMTNISQKRGWFEAQSRRNPFGFQVIVTMKQPVFVEIVKIFDFLDTP